MAKHMRTIPVRGSIDATIRAVMKGVLNRSLSATIDEYLDYSTGDAECHVRNIKRFSAGNESYTLMYLTFVATNDRPGELQVLATTSGGSALLFHQLIWPEEVFMDTLIATLDKLFPETKEE